MNIERVCDVKKGYDEIALGANCPFISDKTRKIIAYEHNGNYFVSCEPSIMILQKCGFYGKLMNSLNVIAEDHPRSEDCLLLSGVEILFLQVVFDSVTVVGYQTKEIISMEQIWTDCVVSNGDRFVALYVAYHYYRSFGWVVRPGLRFGSDYLLYVASPDHSHASYSVCVKQFSGGDGCHEQLTDSELLNQARVSHSVAKHLIFCKVTVDSPHPLTDLAVVHDCSVKEFHISRFDPSYGACSKSDNVKI